jgi:hypothetical protein
MVAQVDSISRVKSMVIIWMIELINPALLQLPEAGR